MKSATVISPWINVGTEQDPIYWPKIVQDHTVACQDTTGQPVGNIPTNPNLAVFQITCDDKTLANIAKDDTYHVIWSDDLDTGESDEHQLEIMDKAEFTALQTYLTTEGLTANQVDQALGTSVSDRSREGVAEGLRTALKALPAAAVAPTSKTTRASSPRSRA